MLSLGFFLASSVLGKAQDPFFTQYKTSGMFMNPAFAGSEACNKIGALYRKSSPMQETNNDAFLLSYDGYSKALHGGFGFSTFYTQKSDLTNTYVQSINIAPKFTIKNKVTLSLGLGVSYIRHKIEAGKLVLIGLSNTNGFQYSVIPSSETEKKVRLNGGFLFNSNRFVFGGSFFKRRLPSILDSKETYTHYNLLGGYNLPLPMIRSNIMFSGLIFNNAGLDYRLNTTLRYKFMLAGIGFGKPQGNKLAYFYLFGLSFNKIELTYSYDQFVSRLGLSTPQGFHELSVNYYLKRRKKQLNPVAIEQVEKP